MIDRSKVMEFSRNMMLRLRGFSLRGAISVVRRKRRWAQGCEQKRLQLTHRKLPYLALTAIIMLGVYVRSIPLMSLNNLIDLDPYNYFMMAEEILKKGVIPTFDPLSLAPQGTSLTYSLTPMGFPLLSVALQTMTGAPLMKMLGIMPVIYGALTILTIFLLGYEITESRSVGLLAASFTAFPRSWALIYSIGMNPVAENVGIFLFILTLLLLTKYLKRRERIYLIFAGLLFGSCFTIHLLTATYLTMVFVTYLILSYVFKRGKGASLAIISSLAVGFLFFSPIFASTVFKTLEGEAIFSRSVAYLTFSKASYLIMLPESLLGELGFPPLMFGLLGITWMLFKRGKKCPLLISWCLSLLTITFAHLAEPFRNSQLFPSLLLLPHRTLPYLSLAFNLLAGIGIAQYALPLIYKLKKPKMNIVAPVTLAFLLLTPMFLTTLSYSEGMAAWANPGTYADFFKWIENNTNASDVFIANHWDMSLWLRAVAGRPTVFSHIRQDLTAPDFERRMMLHSAVFAEGQDENITKQLLREYDVGYVVVVDLPCYLDITHRGWVYAIPDVGQYLKWMDGRGYLIRVFSGKNIWVYRVDKELPSLNMPSNGVVFSFEKIKLSDNISLLSLLEESRMLTK